MAIITATDLAPWVGKTVEQLEDNVLTEPVIEQASLLVNEAVHGTDGEAYWALPDRPAPETARSVATQLAARVFSNPKVVQQQSTGPISRRFADIVLTGMALRPDEIERLQQLKAGGVDGPRLWVLGTMVETPRPVHETVAYVDAAGEMTVSSATYFPTDYDHA